MLVPCGHRLLVKPEKIEDVDKSYAAAKKAGIYIPEMEARKEQLAVDRGVVISLGETAFVDYGGTPWCQVGDMVGYNRYGGKIIKDPKDEQEYVLLNDEDILCRYA